MGVATTTATNTSVSAPLTLTRRNTSRARAESCCCAVEGDFKHLQSASATDATASTGISQYVLLAAVNQINVVNMHVPAHRPSTGAIAKRASASKREPSSEAGPTPKQNSTPS